KEISHEIGVAERVVGALEAGELKASQIMHNFPAATMFKLLRKLQIRVDEFARLLMETATNTGTYGSFTETQAAYRKHLPDDVDILGEITEYIEQIEGLAKDQ